MTMSESMSGFAKELLGGAALCGLLYVVYRYSKRRQQEQFLENWKRQFAGQYDTPEEQTRNVEKIISDLSVDREFCATERRPRYRDTCPTEIATDSGYDSSADRDCAYADGFCVGHSGQEDITIQAAQALKASISVYMRKECLALQSAELDDGRSGRSVFR